MPITNHGKLLTLLLDSMEIWMLVANVGVCVGVLIGAWYGAIVDYRLNIYIYYFSHEEIIYAMPFVD